MASLSAATMNGAPAGVDDAGLAVLFAGPPGTGKTMAAEVLARELGLPLHRVDLSQVVNKYIGETEKNLRRVFDACEASDLIVLFDEADALFGRRTQVRDAHDRYANLEVSYLLSRMERAKGLTILATNRKEDLDGAFLRRLRYVVDFPLPASPSAGGSGTSRSPPRWTPRARPRLPGGALPAHRRPHPVGGVQRLPAERHGRLRAAGAAHGGRARRRAPRARQGRTHDQPRALRPIRRSRARLDEPEGAA